MKLSVDKELSVMSWKACVFFSKDWHIHVDIQIWYPALGETQLNFALSSTQYLISFTYDIDIDWEIRG